MIFDLENFGINIAAITDSGRRYLYSDLYQDGERLDEAIADGSLIFCLCENSWASLVGYVSFLNHHHPSVLLDGRKDAGLLQKLVDVYEPKYLWMPSLRAGEIRGGKVVFVLEGYSLVETPYSIYPVNPRLLLLLTTSGSTGSPKLVRLTEDNLGSNARSIAEYLNIDDKERPITSLPMYYSFGMSVINSHLIKGATLLLTDYGVLQRQFWNFLKEEKATSIAGVPYTYEMLRYLRFFDMELPFLNTMIQAGGKLNPDIVRQYITFARERGKKFIVMYGQTEAAPRMSFLPFDKAGEKYSSIGIPIPGGRMSVLDVEGNIIEKPCLSGELVYEGPNVCMGYAENKEDLLKGDENQGILHTGDIAYRDSDGFFYITGRLKRFVKVWGNRCNLDAVEQLVKALTTACACVGVDDKITVFVTKHGLEGEIKEYLSGKTNLNVRAFDVRVIDAIPTKPSGKIDYIRLQQQL